MKTLACLFFLLCTTPLLAGNAALDYWQAFSLIPKIDEAARDQLLQWKTIEMNDQIVGGVLTLQPALRYLHKGSAQDSCDWGIDWSQGFATMLPHLSKARELALLAAVRGRLHASAGETRDAADCVLDILTLSRHVGQDGSLISFLVRCGIEEIGRDLASMLLGSFSPADLEHLAQGLKRTPENALGNALQNELSISLSSLQGKGMNQINADRIIFLSHFLSTFGARLDEVDGSSLHTMRLVVQTLSDAHYAQVATLFNWPKDRAEILRAVNDAALLREQVSIEQLQTVLLLANEGMHLKDLDLQIQDLESIMAEIIHVVSLDEADFHRRYPEIMERIQASGPLARSLVQETDAAYKKQQQTARAYAALQGAIAVRQNGSAPGFSATEAGGILTLKGATGGSHTFQLTPVAIRASSAIDVDDQKLAKVLEEVKTLAAAKRKDPAYAEFREALRKSMGELLGGLQVNLSEAKGYQALDLLMDDAILQAQSWQLVFESALAGDASARSAAVVFAHADQVEKYLLALVIQRQQVAVAKVIGQPQVDQIIGELKRKQLLAR
jgi:hypothetical protein